MRAKSIKDVAYIADPVPTDTPPAAADTADAAAPTILADAPTINPQCILSNILPYDETKPVVVRATIASVDGGFNLEIILNHWRFYL